MRATNRHYAEGFEPIRESLAAKIPSEQSTEPNIVSGSEGNGVWADASFLVHAPAATVCEVLQLPETVVNDGAVDEWRFRPFEEGEQTTAVEGFVLVNTVHRAIDINFEIAWKFAPVEETEGCVGTWAIQRAPRLIASNRGWISVEALDEELTLVEAQAELDAPRVDPSMPHGYLERLAEKLTLAATMH